MRIGLSAALVVVLAGCGAPVPAATSVASALPAVEVEAPTASPVAVTPPEAERRCGAAKIPALPARLPEAQLPEGESPATCEPRDAVLRQAAAAELTKRYRPRRPGSTLRIDHDCDGLGARIERLDWAFGAGHGFNLSLVRFERRGDDYLAWRLDYRELSSTSTLPPPPTVAVGRLPASEVERAIAGVRAALTSRLVEVEPQAPPGVILGLSGFSSSRDFHSAIELADGDRRKSYRFTGYESSTHQDTYLPLLLAETHLRPLLERLALRDDPIDDGDRVTFASFFAAEAPHFDDPFNWWVKERYVALAEPFGTPALVPLLVERLRPGSDRSTSDTRNDALDALAKLLGADPRLDPAGEPRPQDEVMADLRERCGAVTPAAAARSDDGNSR